MQSRLNEREKVHQVNRDLVTKNCGQSSHIDKLLRDNKALKEKLEAAQNETNKQRLAP